MEAATRLRTRNWTATRISKDITGAGDKVLVVVGEVETTSSNQSLKFAKAQPQGINPNILLLTLTVTTSGIGTDINVWKPIECMETRSVDHYTDVTINGDCAPITIRVENAEN